LEHHQRDVELTEVQRYHVDCWKTCKSIFTSIKKLKIAEECIRQSYRYCENEHEVAEYIEFHIENYLIRSRSVYDRVLSFINYLCDIQMSKEHVNHVSIITNRKVKLSGLNNKLKEINKACEQYRVERNGVVHHDKYSDQELEWVDTARKAKYILKGNVESIGITDEQIINNTAIVISKHMQEFQLNTEKIRSAVNVLMDDAKKIYDHKSYKHNKKFS